MKVEDNIDAHKLVIGEDTAEKLDSETVDSNMNQNKENYNKNLAEGALERWRRAWREFKQEKSVEIHATIYDEQFTISKKVVTVVLSSQISQTTIDSFVVQSTAEIFVE
uniref:Uncharacterized protein n=1 Tax=Romanomermis culicivorax TaxID=13658 RepID=A0A915I9E2_ROMCU